MNDDRFEAPTPSEEAAAELRDWMVDAMRMLGASEDDVTEFLTEYDRLTAEHFDEEGDNQ